MQLFYIPLSCIFFANLKKRNIAISFILSNNAKTNLRIALNVTLLDFVCEVYQARHRVQFPLGITKSLSALKSLTSKCHWRSITMNVCNIMLTNFKLR